MRVTDIAVRLHANDEMTAVGGGTHAWLYVGSADGTDRLSIYADTEDWPAIYRAVGDALLDAGVTLEPEGQQ
jgi:hypothetical protein